MIDSFAPDLMEGRTVFVSGGGSGVNLAIARAVADLGGDVSICGRTGGRLEQAAEHLRSRGARVVTTVADVRDGQAVAEAFARTEAELGPVDGVVCGAAGNFVAPAERISTNGFKAVVDIDLLGSFHVAREAFDHLRRTKGSVVFVSGGQSVTPLADQAHVAAAKAGVDQLMRSMALEWAPHGIRVNSIIPGPVEGTEGMRRLTEGAMGQVWVDSVPLGRFAEGAEIGAMAAVLLSDIASYMTGTQLLVDGGLNLSGGGHITASSGRLAATGGTRA
ncbi:SDR family oxidoreductase [Gordonia hydrophobica]|uniref:SDR family oxidoreductase n=1 Tax=Gordonia hydrophobica TaxID=40516 RepID=A0ABZ2TWC9_9ACTN|nr:SDR family oxidoreductase [Gordonia hydrophobica]MBM7365803.1 NAD(P)-dependent dehydrogenase (short-subunit alcohol dehydrogenase family) [Gordonia hydrophobica]